VKHFETKTGDLPIALAKACLLSYLPDCQSFVIVWHISKSVKSTRWIFSMSWILAVTDGSKSFITIHLTLLTSNLIGLFNDSDTLFLAVIFSSALNLLLPLTI
jgi:hypothetical protein